MKNLILVLVFGLLVVSAFAGKEAVTPQVLLLNSDKTELMSAEFVWGSNPDNNICRVTYRVWNDDRTAILREITFDITEGDFTDLVLGYGGTMESRLEAGIWQDIQSKFNLVP
jgi:hypothetical protein